MSWTTTNTVTIEIDSIDVTSSVQSQSLYIRQNIGNSADVCSFELRDADGAISPSGWSSVTIDVNGTRVFGGYIVQVRVSALDSIDGVPHYEIEAKDWTILFDAVQVSRRYGNYKSGGLWLAWDDDDIISDLFTTYLSGEGFDASTYVTSQGSAEIAFDNVSFRDALNALAAQVQADWYVDPDKKLRWFNPASPGNAAFSISTNNPNYSTSYPPLRASLSKTTDEIGIINSVTVVGGYSENRTNETITYVSGTSLYTLANQHIKSVIQVKANTTAAGPLPATNASNRLGYAPEDSLVDDGGDAWYLIDLKTGTLRLDSSITGYMSAGDTIDVDYVYLTQVSVTRTDPASIATYGRTFSKTFFDESLSNTTAARNRADEILAEYANARVTLSFDTAEHGLLPGRLLTVDAPEIGIASENTIGLENNQIILLENTSLLLTEEAGVAQQLLIQQVEIRPTPTNAGDYLVVASVKAGVYQNTLIEALARLGASSGLSTGGGITPGVRYPGALGNISSDLGEIVGGRATLTDGGTAPFTWGDYAGHTGVVVGVNDSGTVIRGEMLLLQSGTVKAKIGYLDGLTGWGTVTPSGWGVWTTNGYFQGVVAASLLSGGTVEGGYITGGTITGAYVSGGTVTGGTITGGYISGGTVSGAYVSGGTIDSGYLTGVNGDFSGTITATAGSIGGWNIESSYLWSNGGTIQTGSVVNSSNPGVRMEPDGLFGYGTAGVTFAIYSDPAKSPWFSSGTINNAVYEVYEAAVLRTNADVFANGGVQIDSSGIFGVDPLGAGFIAEENDDLLLLENGRLIELESNGVNFMLDTATGAMMAQNAYLSGTVFADSGQFSGTVFASAGTFSGTVTASTITASTLSGGTVSGGYITGGTVTGGYISGGTITGAYVSGVTIDGGHINGGTISTVGGHITLSDANGFRMYNGNTYSGNVYPEDLQFVDSGGTVIGYIQTLAVDSVMRIKCNSDMWLDPGGDLLIYGDVNFQRKIVSNIEPSVGFTYRLGSTSRRWEIVYTQSVDLENLFSSTLRVESGTISMYGVINSHVIPHGDNFDTLGDSLRGWKELYLSDGFGPWKIEVNTSGALITTKMY